MYLEKKPDFNKPPRMTLRGLIVVWFFVIVVWFFVGVPLSLGILAASVYIVMLILQSFGVV